MPWLLANWRLGLVGLAVIAGLSLLAWERHQGAESVRKADAVKAAAAQVHAASVTGQLAGSAVQIGSEASAERERIVYRTRTITERVPYEIPRATDVLLSPRWVSEYNASLGLPESSGPAAKPAGDAGSVYSADALVQAIVPNNGACSWYAENYPRLLTLYDQVEARVNGFRP